MTVSLSTVGPKDFAGEPNVPYRVCDTGKPDGACREVLKVFKKARRDASSPVFNKTTRRVGRMLFLKENAHCATAGDTEQNGAKHFTVARRAIVTCCGRVMIVFAGICKEKTQNQKRASRVKKKFYSLFLWREARYDFEFSLANASQNQS